MFHFVVEELPDSPLAQVSEKLKQTRYVYNFLLIIMFCIAIVVNQAANRHFFSILCNTFCFVCNQQKL